MAAYYVCRHELNVFVHSVLIKGMMCGIRPHVDIVARKSTRSL